MDDRNEPEAAGPEDAAEPGDRARPLPGVQESLRQYSTLLEINNALISNLTRESLFHAISEALRKVVPFDRALLYVTASPRSRPRGACPRERARTAQPGGSMRQ